MVKAKGFALTLGVSNGKISTKMLYQDCSFPDLSMALAVLEVHRKKMVDSLKEMTDKLGKK